MKRIAVRYNTNVIYTFASLLLLLVVFIIDTLLFTAQSKTPPKAFEQPVKAVPKKKLQTTSLSFVNMSLPTPPVNAEVDISIPIETSTSVKNVNHSTQVHAHTSSEHAKNTTVKQRSKHLAQLQSLDGKHLSFSFPSSPNEKEALNILRYMHQCVGIDVGVYDGQNMTLLTHKNQQHSRMMRLASGVRTATEKGLMLSYGGNNTLVRLYPSWFDSKLSSLLSDELGNEELHQFSAQYKLSGDKLYLNNISINQQNKHFEWLLFSAC